MTEQHKDIPSLIERQVEEILNRKKRPVSRLAQLPSTLAGYFSEPVTAGRMITHVAILAMGAAIILTSR